MLKRAWSELLDFSPVRASLEPKDEGLSNVLAGNC